MGERGERSDKKREIKPTLPVTLKDGIYRLAFITRTPVKDVAEEIVIYTLNCPKIRGNIAPYIQRDITLGNTLLHGNEKRLSLRLNEHGEETERLSLRLTRDIYSLVAVLAYGLDVTVSKATALLLREGMQDYEFVERYVRSYLLNSVDEYHLREVEKVLRSVSKDESLASLLSAIVDEVKRPLVSAKQMVGEFLINNWRERD